MASSASASAPLSLPNASALRTSPKQEVAGSMAKQFSEGSATGADTSLADAGVPDITSPHELTAWVEEVLTRLEKNFETMSTQMLDRIEAIGQRIDTVEQSISDLIEGDLSVTRQLSDASASA